MEFEQTLGWEIYDAEIAYILRRLESWRAKKGQRQNAIFTDSISSDEFNGECLTQNLLKMHRCPLA
jgi:hypothetical protein